MELNFETGVQSFPVNGVEDALRMNPTDIEMLRKIYVAMKELEAKQNAMHAPSSKGESGNSEESFDTLHESDQEMREVLDGIFGHGFCEKVFGEMSLYASAKGLPVWLNFILAVIDLFDDAIKREAALSDKRIQKHVQKYHR